MIAKDKQAHMIAGALVGAGAAVVVGVATVVGIPAAIFVGAAGVGVGYEVVQRIRGDGQPDPVDAAATAVGGAVVAAVWGLINGF